MYGQPNNAQQGYPQQGYQQQPGYGQPQPGYGGPPQGYPQQMHPQYMQQQQQQQQQQAGYGGQGMQPGMPMMPQGGMMPGMPYGGPQQGYAQGQQQARQMGGGPPQDGMSMTMGMNTGAAVFTPGGSFTPVAPAQAEPSTPALTDEEQSWLDQQITDSAAEAAKQAAEKAEKLKQEKAARDQNEPSLEDVPSELRSAETKEAVEPEGGYDDVMALIEANRKKNEERRAAQSERNAAIVATFEARGT